MSLPPAISIHNLVKRYAPSGKAAGKLALVKAKQAFFSALEMLPLALVSTTKCVCTEAPLAVPVQAMSLPFNGHTRKLASAAWLMQPLTTRAAGADRLGAAAKTGANRLSRACAWLC